jgi:hypothetical protein
MIPKDKVMLQLPVKKVIADEFSKMAAEVKMKKGDFFAAMFVEWLAFNIEEAKKGGEKNGKSKEKDNTDVCAKS